MTRTLAISDIGLRLIKAFEGYRPGDRTLATGVRVVGYGHRLDADADPVHLSRNEAEERLLEDLEPVELMVNEDVHAPLTQGQYDALCSLVFNIGLDAFRASDILQALNNGRVLDAANGFDVWRKAEVNGRTFVVDALMRRRTAEKSLFLRNEPAVPAPSALLVPRRDADAARTETDDGLRPEADRVGLGVVSAATIAPAAGSLSQPGTGADTLSHTGDDDLASDPQTQGVARDCTRNADQGPGLADLGAQDGADALAFLLDSDDLVAGTARTLPGPLPDAGDILRTIDPGAPLAIDGQAEADVVADETADVPPATDKIADPAENGQDAGRASEGADLDPMDGIDTDAAAPVQASAIAEAADSLGSRLSALLDADEGGRQDDVSEPPRLAAMAAAMPATGPDRVLASDIVVTPRRETVHSNLVSFPSRERLMPEPDPSDPKAPDPIASNEEGANDTAPVSAAPVSAPVSAPAEDASDRSDRVVAIRPPEMQAEPGSSADAPVAANETGSERSVVIDNLAADDVLRASRDPANAIHDPVGDSVENALRYLDSQSGAGRTSRTGGGLWIPMALGASLVGFSAMLMGRGATDLLAAWGPAAVAAAAITGGLTLLFAFYAFARGRFA
ncbi:lysozyme [uncultured Algimonas sp.]|uniref:lysozyme n=1 Tax=uncultured Algimonas sp. TaxID=1547920 RepID=UPI0026346538|nr:lysozyme [uncultured Algimonas sp.]